MDSTFSSRKAKNAQLNTDLFSFDCRLSSRFINSTALATKKEAEEELPAISPALVSTPLVQDADIIDRLRCLEEHLGVGSSELDVSGRLKILEDKIMRIEEIYPQVAIRVFKYEPSIPKGAGRLSKLPDSFISNSVDETADVQSRKIDEMKSRLNELKANLSK